MGSKTHTETRQCSIEGCERKHEARGYCKRHYYRLRHMGDVGPVGRIRREKGTGHNSVSGYNIRMENGESKPEHVWMAEKAMV